MKTKYTIKVNGKIIERQYSYIPVRYILAVLITIFEVLVIIGIVGALSAVCFLVGFSLIVYNQLIEDTFEQ